MIYSGAFRLPDNFVNGDGFTIGGRPVAYNPARNSLFIGSRNGRLAEVTIPAPVNSANINSLPFASFLQGFYDPTEGNMWQIAGDGASIDGILVHGDRLYGSASIYYDANNTQRVSHYSRSTTLSSPSFVGMAPVWQSDMTGFVSGYMANVPAEWQAKLGAPAITGQCCLPIAWRTSWGPSAFGWNPSQLSSRSLVPATPLLYYPHDHHTLGHWDASGPAYGGTTQINGVAIIAGTRTALFFGRNGTGPFCYGNGTADQSLAGKLGPDNEIYCYDPTSPAKGQHAYPYQYQIWAYDLNDLAAVKAGAKQPWDVVPYGVWPFSFPTPEPMVRIGGVGYDSVRQTLYVSQLLADQDGYGYRPIIHALKIGNAPGSTLPPPEPAPAPAPSPSVRVTTVGISANKVAPQPPGTTVTFTAAPTGGTTPLQYKWWTYDGSWKPVGGWTSSNTFAWTPSTTYPSGRITVWAKSAGNTADEAEASVAMDFVISGTAVTPPTSSTRVSTVAISANMAAPQPPGTTVTFSAAPSGGGAPLQYKWWLYDGSWKPAGGWTTSSTFAWTPATTYPSGRVTVWVKSAANTADEAEASAAMDFVISGTAVAAPSPSPSPATSTRVSSVAISANMAAPQPPGTTVTFSAAPNGGGAPHQYKWWIYDGSWKPVTGWTTASTFAWTPTTSYPSGRVTVWVRSASNTADEAEASTAMDFVISGTAISAPAPAPAPATSTSRVSAVAIAADKASPQAPGTTVTFSATPSGGGAPHQYKWWIYDGAWKPVTGWTNSSAFAWTPSTAYPTGRVTVWVRSASNTVDEAEASVAMDFIISGTAAPAPAPSTSSRVTSVLIGANRVSPQPPGTTVTFSAAPTGGTGPLQYKWWIYDGGWKVMGGWTTSSTFAWTPAIAYPYGRVTVWVRSAANTLDEAEASAAMDFVISGTPVTSQPAVVSSVSLGANKIAPQPRGSSITWTATAAGGVTPYQYKFLVWDGASRIVVRAWSTSNTFTWTPTMANQYYKVIVWVRSNGNIADAPEFTTEVAYPIQ